MLLTQIADKISCGYIYQNCLMRPSYTSYHITLPGYITSLLQLMQFWGFLLFSCTFLTPQQTKAMFSELKFVFTEPYFIPSGRKSKSYNCHYMF